MRRLALTALAALALALPSSAAATTCTSKIHWHKKTHRVHGHLRVVYHRVHGHRKPVWIKTIVKTCTPTPAPSAKQPVPIDSVGTTPRPAARLHAHLDPSFVQDRSEPLHVTYSYSASATNAVFATDSIVEEPTPLPEGILNLYSDGTLACSTEVGGEQSTERECPVAYTTPGEHTVIVTYQSGTTTATETEVEHIERLPSAIALTQGYIPTPAPNSHQYLGTLTLAAEVNGPTPAAKSIEWCLSDPASETGWSCRKGDARASFEVTEDTARPEQAELSELTGNLGEWRGINNGLFEAACATEGICPKGEPGFHRATLGDGRLSIRVTYLGSSGFEPSGPTSAPLIFTP